MWETVWMVVVITLSATLADRWIFLKGHAVRQGIWFGIFAIIANSFSADIANLHVSVGLIDVPPIIAGFFFGPVAGLISGAIAAIERALTPLWGVGGATWGRCSIATFLVSAYASLLSVVFHRYRPALISAVVAAAFGEIIHLTLIFMMGLDDLSLTFEVFWAAFPIMVGGAAAAAGLFSIICHSWKEWEKDYGASPSVAFFIMALAFTLLAFVSWHVACSNTDRVIEHALDDYEMAIRDQLNFAMHRCAYHVSHELGGVKPFSRAEMQRIANEHGLDEVSIIGQNELIAASNDSLSLMNRDFSRSNLFAEAFFNMLDQNDVVTKQWFRPNIIDPNIISCYVGVPLFERNGFLEIGYSYARFEKEFSLFFMPQLENMQILSSGFFLVSDEHGHVVRAAQNASDAKGKRLSDIGFSLENLKAQPRQLFTARILNDWSRCTLLRKIGKWRIYAVLPLREIYASITEIMLISGIVLFVLCMGLYWMVIRVKNTQHSLEKLRQLEKKHRQDDIELAHMVQNSELKEDNPETERYSIEAIMHPAREVGGDFYDYYDVPSGKTVIGIGDVSGKGMPAAIFMMKAKTTLQLYSIRGESISNIMFHANNHLCKHNDAQMFVTAWSGVFDPETGDLEYVSAGHNPPLLIRACGRLEWVPCNHAVPLGICPDRKYPSQKLHLDHGDRLFLYTDGVTEAMNAAKKLFGERKLAEVVQKGSKGRLPLITLVMRALQKFTKGFPQSDDITMLSMQVK